jgi:hypothetical protein
LVESDGVCSDISVLELGVITGVYNESYEALSLLPNPTKENIIIESQTRINSTFSISDLNGRICIRGVIQGYSTAVSVEHLPAGIYILQFDGNPEWRKKIIKQ